MEKATKPDQALSLLLDSEWSRLRIPSSKIETSSLDPAEIHLSRPLVFFESLSSDRCPFPGPAMASPGIPRGIPRGMGLACRGRGRTSGLILLGTGGFWEVLDHRSGSAAEFLGCSWALGEGKGYLKHHRGIEIAIWIWTIDQ